MTAKEFKAAIKKLYSSAYTAAKNGNMNKVKTILLTDISKVYDEYYTSVVNSDLPQITINKLKKNLNDFSKGKSVTLFGEINAKYKQTRTANNPTDAFKTGFDSIWVKHNREYMITESDFVTKKSNNMKAMEEMIDKGETEDNYQYLAVMDGRTRSSHAELDGVIRPANDPFWSTHTPPWDFNCRCTRVKINKPATKVKGGNVKPPKELNVNPSQAEFFTDEHKYIKNYKKFKWKQE